jgi:uncharacterized protein YqeY
MPKGPQEPGLTDAATFTKNRIRGDLTAAMKARRNAETSLLRGILAALDNAEAVSVGTAHDRYKVRMFGDPSVEMPRRALSEADVHNLLLHEAAEREAAGREFEKLSMQEEAARLRNEISLIARYLK